MVASSTLLWSAMTEDKMKQEEQRIQPEDLLSRFKSIYKRLDEAKNPPKPLEPEEDLDGDKKEDEEEKLVACHFQESLISEETEGGHSLAKLAKDRGLKHSGYGYWKNASGKTFVANKTKTDFVPLQKKLKTGDDKAKKKPEEKDIKNHKQLYKELLKRKARKEGKSLSDEELDKKPDSMMSKKSIKVSDGELKLREKTGKKKITKADIKSNKGDHSKASMNEANRAVKDLPVDTLVEFKIEWENGSTHKGSFVVTEDVKTSRTPISSRIRHFFATHTGLLEAENEDLPELTKELLGEESFENMVKFLYHYEIGDEVEDIFQNK